jgi:hypothetical protein
MGHQARWTAIASAPGARYPFLILGWVRPQRMRGPSGASLTIVSFRTATRAVFWRRRTLAGTARSCGGRPAFGDRGCWRGAATMRVLLCGRPSAPPSGWTALHRSCQVPGGGSGELVAALPARWSAEASPHLGRRRDSDGGPLPGQRLESRRFPSWQTACSQTAMAGSPHGRRQIRALVRRSGAAGSGDGASRRAARRPAGRRYVMVEAIRDQWVIAAGVVVLVAAFLVWLYTGR